MFRKGVRPASYLPNQLVQTVGCFSIGQLPMSFNWALPVFFQLRDVVVGCAPIRHHHIPLRIVNQSIVRRFKNQERLTQIRQNFLRRWTGTRGLCWYKDQVLIAFRERWEICSGSLCCPSKLLTTGGEHNLKVMDCILFGAFLLQWKEKKKEWVFLFPFPENKENKEYSKQAWTFLVYF